MVTTRITEAVPITIPSAVRAKRSLLARKLSRASFRISLMSIVRRALSNVCWNAVRRACSTAGFIVSYCLGRAIVAEASAQSLDARGSKADA